MKTLCLSAGLLLAFITGAAAQNAVVVASCGSAPATYSAGESRQVVMNTNGELCTGGGGGAVTSTQLPATLTTGGSLKVSEVDPTTGVALTSPASSTVTSVSDAATSTTCLASNANRQGGRFYNDSTVNAYLLEDEGTASSTNFTTIMIPGAFYALPMNTLGVYTDDVKCIWASDASGAMRVTEITP